MSAGGRDSTRSAQRFDGALAGAVALALLWALWRIDPRVTFAPLGVGDRLIRMTPGSVSGYLIEHLQHDAQRLAAAGATLLLLAVAALLARVLPRLWAVSAFGSLVAIAGLVEPVAPNPGRSLLTAALAGTAYALSLRVLHPVVEVAPTGFVSASSQAVSRRGALMRIAGAIVGLLGAGTLLRGAAGPQRSVTLARLLGPDPGRRARFPDIPGLSDAVTPVAGHYVVDIDLSDPLLDAREWRLHVDGLVQTPLTLGFDELQRRFALISEPSVLTCISNEVGGPLVGCSDWLGVRLADVLHAAGVRSGAAGLAFHCADGYSVGVPMWAAMHASALVAVGQNGQPLTRDHGFPCRIRVPALYGMMNAKWVQRISVVDHRYLGYWQRQGWAPDAQVRTQSRIDAITPTRAGQTGWIAGVAWAGVRGVQRVAVSMDGGRSWQRARLPRAISPWAWRAWVLDWTPPAAGRYEVTCRAVDGNAVPQDATRRGTRRAAGRGRLARPATTTAA